MLGTNWVHSRANRKGKGSVLGHEEAHNWKRVAATDNFPSLWATEMHLVGRELGKWEYTEIKWRSGRQRRGFVLGLGRETH